MAKKNLNWDVPEEVAVKFDEMVTQQWGAKGKWVGACAAMLLYMGEDEQARLMLGGEVTKARAMGQLDALVDKYAAPRAPKKIAAKKAPKATRTTRSRPPQS